MNVVIIGASGYIGSFLYQYYSRLENVDTLIGTQFQSVNPKLLKFDLLQDNIECLLKDHLPTLKDTYVILCSAAASIDYCYTHAAESYDLNVTSTLRAATQLDRMGIKYAFISSEAVFDGRSGFYCEQDPTSPVTLYGKYKLEVEKEILSQSPFGLIIRVSRAISKENKKGQLFSEFYQTIHEGRPIICIKGQAFTPTYLGDIAEVLLLLFTKEKSGVWHVSNHEIFTRSQLAKLFCNEWNLTPVDIIEKPYEDFHFADNRHLLAGLNGKKSEQELNFRYTPVIDIIKEFQLEGK